MFQYAREIDDLSAQDKDAVREKDIIEISSLLRNETLIYTIWPKS